MDIWRNCSLKNLSNKENISTPPPQSLKLFVPLKLYPCYSPSLIISSLLPQNLVTSLLPNSPSPRHPVLLLTPYAQDLTSSRASSANTISPLTISLSPT